MTTAVLLAIACLPLAFPAYTARAQVVPPPTHRPLRQNIVLTARLLPLRIDFGSGRYTVGAAHCRSGSRDTGYGWFDGLVRDVDRDSSIDPWLSDFTEGEDATFVIALTPPDSTYELHLTLGDEETPRGPVTVIVNDLPVADSLVTPPGVHQEVSCRATATGGRISIRFLSHDCRGFAVNGLEIKGPARARVGRLFQEDSAAEVIPPPEALLTIRPGGERTLLRDLCDFLVRNRPRQGGFSFHGAWYQNAFPIRTLIAGSRILNEPSYAAPALACLDGFVSRQLPDGNWLSAYFASEACDTAVPADTSNANLADIGTMAACLSLVAPLVDDARRVRYLHAAEVYARNVSLPNQYANGAFVNRRWGGRDSIHPYSIATATQTLSLQALYNATCDPAYQEAAERGARWLAARTFLPDGRLTLYPHDRNVVEIHEATEFGDAFYIADALLYVRGFTNDDSLRDAIDTGLDRWFFGEKGLLAKTQEGYWWPTQNAWGDSKMGGMIYVLANHPRRRTDPVLRTWLGRTLEWMADPDRRRCIGVTAEPASLRGVYALAATGFAGIGVAAAIEPDVMNPTFRPLAEPVTFTLPDESSSEGTYHEHRRP